MNFSLLLSLLSALLPLTGAVPGHGHSHAHAHRDFHDHIQQRDQGHTHHGHVHNRDILEVQQHDIKPRAPPSSGCGRKPKPKGTGKGKPVLSSSLLPSAVLPSGPLNNSGGVFATSNTDAVAASTSSTSETSSPTIVVPEIPATSAATSSSSLEAVETPQIAIASDVASASSSVLEAFQSSYTLATRTSASPVTAATSEAATITASSSADSGSGSGAGAGSQTGDADNLTVVVRNMMADPLTTSHAMNADLPAHVLAITATLTDGTMAAGATATMIYPSGWAGNMFAAKAASSEDEVVDLADGSLIEGSFVPQMGDTPVNDMDVSYV